MTIMMMVAGNGGPSVLPFPSAQLPFPVLRGSQTSSSQREQQHKQQRVSSLLFQRHNLQSLWRKKQSSPVFCSKTSVLHTSTESELQLEQVLERMSIALGVKDCPLDVHFTAKGRQVSFGLEGDWELVWCLDGRFYEKFSSAEMTIEYGFDGKESPWHADAAGLVSDLELDNLESCQLALWVRTGYWLTKTGRQKLLIRKDEKSSINRETQSNSQLWLSVSLKGKKVESFVLVDLHSWLPIRMELDAYGSVEIWDFEGWQSILPGMNFKFAMSTLYSPAPGGKHSYIVGKSGVDCQRQQDRADIYDHPGTLLVPRHTTHYPHVHLDPSYPPSVTMIRAKSGHHLVCPLIDGTNMGYFIVDTGASGLVISRKKADEVDMDAFGDVYITGVEGKFKTQFRRGKRFELGPVKIDSPIFIQAPLDDVVRGVTEPVSGICGYDIFCQCVVEMSSAESRLSFYDPLLYTPIGFQPKWEVLQMLDNTPHLEVKFKGRSALLMLDTGAGGIDIIFHNRAVKELNLLDTMEWRGLGEISGVGTGKSGIKVEQFILESIEFAGQIFFQLRTLHFTVDGQALDISIYTSGVLCGELILKNLAVFDYPNRRFALVQR